jgi:hypothetical protein
MTEYVVLSVVPTPLVIEIFPAVKPAGVTAVIDVFDSTAKDAAATPLKRTEVVPLKLFPEMVTVCPPPTQNVVGLYEIMTGTAGVNTVSV